MLRHSYEYLVKKEKCNFTKIVLLRPVTPFKEGSLIDKVVEKLDRNESLSSVRTVTKVKGVLHPYWTFKAQAGILKPFIKNVSIAKYYQSQLLPECFRLNGVVDVIRAERVVCPEGMYGK